MQKQSAYSVLAKFYDKLLGQHCDYEKWSQYLYTVLSVVKAKKGVDLACGTGRMTMLLRKQGFNVVGMDNSVEMLNVARTVSNGVYVCCDMLNFEVGNKVDFVTCVNDGVNYINDEDLPQLFARVFNALRPGGVFVFDISSSYKLTTILNNNVFYYDNEQCTCLWSNHLNKDRVTMDITLFEATDNGLYCRQDEKHIQYIHSESDVMQCLNQCGFINVKATDTYTDKKVTDKTQRITFTAYKSL